MCGPCFLCNTINYPLLCNREEIVNYLNLLFELNERQFWKRGKHNHSNSLLKLIKLEMSKFLKRKEPQRFDLKIDYIGLILVVAVHWFTIIPIVYLPAPIISPNEAMSLALNLFLDGLDQYPIWVSFPLRLSTGLGSINCAREACRAIAVIFVVLVVVADATVKLVKRVKRISDKGDITGAIQEYQLLYSVHVKSIRPAAQMLFFAVEGGVMIAIMSLTGTFTGWGVLSPILYWINPVMAVLTIIIIAIAMPCAAYSAEVSMKLIRDWKLNVDHCRTGSRKLNQRVLRTFQPVAFYMNGRGYLLGETKTAMFTTIIMNTVDSVLMCSDMLR